MNEETWQLTENLALQLVQQGVSHNLVRQAAAFTRRYGGAAALQEWLSRLEKLGSTFASGNEVATHKERLALQQILLPAVRQFPRQNWAQLLAWVARQMVAHPAPPRPREQSFHRR